MNTRTLLWIGIAGAVAWYLYNRAHAIDSGGGLLQQRNEQLRIHTWSEWQSPSVVN